LYWKVDDVMQRGEGLDPEETEVKPRRRFLLRFYRVFNLEQCDLPQAVTDTLPKIETHQHDPIEAVEKIIAGMPDRPEIIRAGSKAFYSPLTDRVTLPPRELFISAAEESATILHELLHYAEFRIMPRLPRRSFSKPELSGFGIGIIRSDKSGRKVRRSTVNAKADAARISSGETEFRLTVRV
jgi:antirestriction protein ArdC